MSLWFPLSLTCCLPIGRILTARWNTNEDRWNDVKAHVFLHKLNYRKADEAAKNPRGFYNVLFTQKENLSHADIADDTDLLGKISVICEISVERI